MSRSQLIKLFDVQEFESALSTMNKEPREGILDLVSKTPDTSRIRIRKTVDDIKEIQGEMLKIFPNFADAIDKIFSQLLLTAMSASKGLYFQPILLSGPAGVGKTQFAQTLSEKLQLGFTKLDLSTATTGMVITGSTAKWSNSSMGEVAKLLFTSRTANPVLFLDEIDKASTDSQSRHGSVMDALLTLLESSSAKTFKDEHLMFPIDASHINVVATCNDLSVLTPWILSRFIVVEVTEPTPDQIKAIAPGVLRNLLEEFELDTVFIPALTKSSLDELNTGSVSVRVLRRVLSRAVQYAFSRGMQCVQPRDIRKAVQELHEVEAKGGNKSDYQGGRGFGFIQ